VALHQGPAAEHALHAGGERLGTVDHQHGHVEAGQIPGQRSASAVWVAALNRRGHVGVAAGGGTGQHPLHHQLTEQVGMSGD
jgi:hypothetical protein